MSRLLKISVLILLLFTICAPTCVDDHDAANREMLIVDEAKNEIRAEFETETLNEASLIAFEEAAKQKLSDLADYLNVIADTSLNLAFRKKAGEMIRSTFINENVSLQIFKPESKPDVGINVSQLIKLGLEDEILLPFYTVDSMDIKTHLQKVQHDSYEGMLNFRQYFLDVSLSNKNDVCILRQAEIFVQKEIKVFGSDTLKVWNVCLGTIR